MKDTIICPHCGCDHEDWWEFVDFERDEHEFEMDCEDCGKEFNVDVVVKRSFSTFKAR